MHGGRRGRGHGGPHHGVVLRRPAGRGAPRTRGAESVVGAPGRSGAGAGAAVVRGHRVGRHHCDGAWSQAVRAGRRAHPRAATGRRDVDGGRPVSRAPRRLHDVPVAGRADAGARARRPGVERDGRGRGRPSVAPGRAVVPRAPRPDVRRGVRRDRERLRADRPRARPGGRPRDRGRGDPIHGYGPPSLPRHRRHRRTRRVRVRRRRRVARRPARRHRGRGERVAARRHPPDRRPGGRRRRRRRADVRPRPVPRPAHRPPRDRDRGRGVRHLETGHGVLRARPASPRQVLHVRRVGPPTPSRQRQSVIRARSALSGSSQ